MTSAFRLDLAPERVDAGVPLVWDLLKHSSFSSRTNGEGHIRVRRAFFDALLIGHTQQAEDNRHDNGRAEEKVDELGGGLLIGEVTLQNRPRARLAGESRLVVLDHPVDDAVRLGLLGAHEVVALGVLGDLVERLAGVLGDDLI